MKVLELLKAASVALYALLQAEAQAFALSHSAPQTSSNEKNKTQKGAKNTPGMTGPGSTITRPDSVHGTGMFLEPQRVDEELWTTVTESVVEILGNKCIYNPSYSCSRFAS